MLKLLAVLCAVWHVSVATQIFTIANALVQTFQSNDDGSVLVNLNGAFPFFTKQYTSAYAYEPENVDCFFFAPLVFYLFLFNSYKIRKHHRQGVCNGPVFHGFICTN